MLFNCFFPVSHIGNNNFSCRFSLFISIHFFKNLQFKTHNIFTFPPTKDIFSSTMIPFFTLVLLLG